MNTSSEVGLISQNEEVRKWVLQIPKCPKCNFFIKLEFSGPRNDCIWPVCSNVDCSLHYPVHTFINPSLENNK